MELKNRRNAQEWSGIFSDWRRSGESQRGYCIREGISISAFGYWHRKLKKDVAEQQIAKISSLAVHPTARENAFTARCGGVLVELTGWESEDFLISVFRALKAIS
jgi:hypothetical protein